MDMDTEPRQEGRNPAMRVFKGQVRVCACVLSLSLFLADLESGSFHQV